MERTYIINTGLLKQLLDSEAKKIVGKTCKRFELLFDDNIKKSLTKEEILLLKKEIKELLYEWCRDLSDSINLIVTTDKAIQVSIINKEGEIHGK